MVLPQIVAIGIYNSDIAAKNKVISKNRKTTMFEIELPIVEGGVSYINESSKHITTDTVICAKPGQTRHTRFPFKCYYVHMIIHGGKLYDKLINTPDYIETNKADVYKTIFTKLLKHYDVLSDDKEVILQSLILELIYTICNDSDRIIKKHSSGQSYTIIEKALNHIRDNLTDDLSLESIAKSVALSPVHFHNSFKTAVGKTLREYVEEQRIKKATNLLLTTNYTLTEIAYECGFSSQSYFSYVFKRKMKMTPREYVKQIYDKYEI